MTPVERIYIEAAQTLRLYDKDSAYRDIAAILGKPLEHVRDLAWQMRAADRRSYDAARRANGIKARRASRTRLPKGTYSPRLKMRAIKFVSEGVNGA